MLLVNVGFFRSAALITENAMSDDQEHLLDYQCTRSEAAFEKIVQRYLSLVYSAALRQAGDQPHLVQDIVQRVFIDFASEAVRLKSEIKVGGWLHRHTCFVARLTLRSERRRNLREEKAEQMNAPSQSNASDESPFAEIAPILDSAIDSLGDKDRQAILLRFYENRDLRSVGAALGTTEDAAQKRVGRALEKLRSLLARQGAVISTTSLALLLAGKITVAAPVGWASTVAGTAFAGAAALGASQTANAFTFIMITKSKIACAAAILTAGLTTTVVLQQNHNDRLQMDNDELRQQIVTLNSSQPAQSAPLDSSAQQTNRALDREQFLELMRLRAQVGQLRALTNENHTSENEKCRAASGAAKNENISDSNPPRFIPKEEWTFAGYAQPDTAFQSTVWGMMKRDIPAITGGWTEQYLQKRTKGWKGKSDEEITQELARDMEHVGGFTITEKNVVNESEMLLNIVVQSTAGNEPLKRKARMKRVGNDWRFDGFHDAPVDTTDEGQQVQE